MILLDLLAERRQVDAPKVDFSALRLQRDRTRYEIAVKGAVDDLAVNGRSEAAIFGNDHIAIPFARFVLDAFHPFYPDQLTDHTTRASATAGALFTITLTTLDPHVIRL